MPQQETFFQQTAGERTIAVVKIYDEGSAREVFGRMDTAAQEHLWRFLKVEENFDAADIPAPGTPDSEDLLWEELISASREDWNLFSFFVVNETNRGVTASLYVSPDWPSAEAFAHKRLPLTAV